MAISRILPVCLLLLLGAPSFAQLVPPKLRLPDSVRPSSYAADLHITPGQESFSGSIDIQLQVLKPVSTIWLYAKSLKFQQAELRTSAQALTPKVKQWPNDLVSFSLPSLLPAGSASLHIVYTGEVSRTLTDGAFQQKQSRSGQPDDWYIFTKFEPVTARRVFPCFDEPAFKVPWQLTLHVPEEFKAFSNTPVEHTRNEPGGTRAVRFARTQPLPSYLIAFAVGPFEAVPTTPVGKNHRPSNIIVPRGRASEAAYAASVTPKLIELLETYFGIPYPYEKLEQIAVPLTTAWGAMENAGLIAYGARYLLSPPDRDTSLRRQGRTSTMTHEMSHQWFGDLVTMRWWDDIWLNEAFASWLSSKLLDEWKPEWHIRADQARSTYVMRSDSLTTARRIRQPIESPGDIGNAFDGITYGKGQAVITTFENYLGAGVFRKAIQTYLNKNASGTASSSDLLSIIDQTAPGKHAGAAFHTFLNQVGFPLVNVALDCRQGASGSSAAATRLTLSQQRFVPVGSPSAPEETWQVPVCTAWQDDAGVHRTCNLLSERSQTFELSKGQGCPAWLFADAGGAGYYAITYAPSLGEKLLAKAPLPLQPVENAAALRNVQILFESGIGNLKQHLQFAAKHSAVSDAGLVRQAAGMIGRMAKVVADDLQPQYRELLHSLYEVRAHQLGWSIEPGEEQETRLLRMEIVPLLATLGEDKALQTEAMKRARAWLKTRSSVDPDLVAPILYSAAWVGNREFFNELVTAIKNTKIQLERSWMIAALPGFRDPALAKDALNLIFNQDIDPRELQSNLFDSSRANREFTWQFIQGNFDKLNARLPGARGIPMGAILPRATAGFCDAAHANQVESFFRPRLAALPGGSLSLSNTLESIRLCAARAKASAPAIASFLNE